MRDFLMSVKRSDGSFAVHTGGEVDIRGSYCALAIASILNILDEELKENVESWVIRQFEFVHKNLIEGFHELLAFDGKILHMWAQVVFVIYGKLTQV